MKSFSNLFRGLPRLFFPVTVSIEGYILEVCCFSFSLCGQTRKVGPPRFLGSSKLRNRDCPGKSGQLAGLEKLTWDEWRRRIQNKFIHSSPHRGGAECLEEKKSEILTWAIRWCCNVIIRDTAICIPPNTATTSKIRSSNEGAVKVYMTTWQTRNKILLRHSFNNL